MRFVQPHLRFTAVLQATLATTTISVTACSKKDEDTRGFGPYFRANFPGEPCKDLRFTVGRASELCAKPEWKDLCSSRVMRDEWELAIVHGDYNGPVCEKEADECRPPENIKITAAATRRDPKDNWMPPFGDQEVGSRTISLGRTLAAGCSPREQQLLKQRAEERDALLAELAKDSFPAWTPEVHRNVWTMVGGEIDRKDIASCPELELLQADLKDDEFEEKRKERERDRVRGECAARRKKASGSTTRYKLTLPVRVGSYDFDKQALRLAPESDVVDFSTRHEKEHGRLYLAPGAWSQVGYCEQPPSGLLELERIDEDIGVPIDELRGKELKQRLSKPEAEPRVEIIFDIGTERIETNITCTIQGVTFPLKDFSGHVLAMRVVDIGGAAVPWHVVK